MVRLRNFVGIGMIVLFVLISSNQKGFTEVHYKVKSGDSLYSISKSFNISIKTLKKTNHLNGNGIKPKMVLLIPTPEERQREKVSKGGSIETEPYVVRKGDTLCSISKRMSISIDEIKKMNQLHSTSLKINQVLLLPKLEGMEETEAESIIGDEQITEELLDDGNNHGVSEPLSKWNHPGERDLFVKVVKTYLGAPYRLGGSTMKGIDCSAFVKKVYEVFDVSLPRTAREQFCIGKKVEKYQLEEGDLVFFKRQGNNAHVGIYIGGNQFVHASSSCKEIKIDNLETPYYRQRFLSGVRVKELEMSVPTL